MMRGSGLWLIFLSCLAGWCEKKVIYCKERVVVVENLGGRLWKKVKSLGILNGVTNELGVDSGKS